jgi:UDP-glucose 4-epimerase
MAAKPIAVVTGGAGFIGSHMVDLLVERGYRVHVVDNLAGGREANLAQHAANPDVALERRDIRSYAAGDAFFKDARHVLHFAGIGDLVPAIERPLEYLSVNVQGTVQMLECARGAGGTLRKFVYAASSTCYGLADVPTTEDHPIRPEHPYALSKNLGEQACLHWHRVYGLPVNVIRIFNAYGTRARTSGAYGAVFGVFLRQKLAGKPFTVVGDGTQRRDFVYVTDVARAFLAACESGLAGRTWNVGAGNPQSVNRLVELLGGEAVHIPKRPGEPDCTFADISRIRRELGWEPLVSFEQGVAQVLENIDYWRDAPLWDEASIAQATETWFRYLAAPPRYPRCRWRRWPPRARTGFRSSARPAGCR